jgi:hypothetical protein
MYIEAIEIIPASTSSRKIMELPLSSRSIPCLLFFRAAAMLPPH